MGPASDFSKSQKTVSMDAEECLRKNGVKWEKPILTIDTFGTPAIPNLRITRHGYVRLKDWEIFFLEI